MKKILYLLLFILGVTTSNAFAQYTTSGKDFWLGFMENWLGEGDTLYPIVYLSSRVATSATVSIPKTGWSQTINIPANTVKSVLVPKNQAHTRGSDVVGNSIYVEALDSISVYALNINPNTTDGTIILPLQTLQDDYYVSTYFENPPSQIETDVVNNSPLFRSEFMVVATQDSTEIEITVPVDTKDFIHLAGETFTITLNLGECYQVQAYGDLTGTRIRGANTDQACRGFAVFGGNGCTFVGNCWACDHLYEQMFPTESWGYRFGLLGAKNKTADVYRIIASEDNTNIMIDGVSVATINAGKYYTKSLATMLNNKAAYVQTNKPVSVSMVCRGSQCDDIGVFSDPFILIIPPLDVLVTNDQTVATFSPNNYTLSIDAWSHYINIFTKTANKASMQVSLNGGAFQSIAALFKPITANPEYSWADFNTSIEGMYRIKGNDGFYAYVYGFANDDSYGYSGATTFFSPPLLNSSAYVETQASCYGLNDAKINVKIKSGVPPFRYTFSWRPTIDTIRSHALDTTFTNIPAGDVIVYVIDSLGCKNVNYLKVTAPPQLQFKDPAYAEVCKPEGMFALPAVQDTSIQPGDFWVYPQGITNVLVNGKPGLNLSQTQAGNNYVFKYRRQSTGGPQDSCFTPFTLHIMKELDIRLKEKQDVSCKGLSDGSITLEQPEGEGPFKIYWSHDAGLPPTTRKVTNLPADTYTITVEDRAGCQKELEVPITEPAAEIRDSTSSQYVCDQNSIILNPTQPGGIKFEWFPGGSTQSSILAKKSGPYRVRVYLSASNISCYFTDSFNLTFVKSLHAKDSIQCDPKTIVAPEIGVPGAMYEWTHGGTERTTVITEPKSYVANITFPNGNCGVNYTVDVVRTKECDAKFDIPNAFSPNFLPDGANDVWKVYSVNMKAQKVMIFSRWGQKVYEQETGPGIDVEWNGRFNGTGTPVQEGVYTYSFTGVTIKDQTVSRVGTITLFR